MVDLRFRDEIISTISPNRLQSHIANAVGSLDLERDDAVVVGVASVAEQAAFVHAALREVNRPCALPG